MSGNAKPSPLSPEANPIARVVKDKKRKEPLQIIFLKEFAERVLFWGLGGVGIAAASEGSLNAFLIVMTLAAFLGISSAVFAAAAEAELRFMISCFGNLLAVITPDVMLSALAKAIADEKP